MPAMSSGSRRDPGERIGDFEIVKYLASGGMGDVYVGRDVHSGEAVALKFLAESSPAAVARFEREGRIASGLRHPHVVSGRGFGRTDDGVAYIAMELLRGEDLDDRLAREGISANDVLRVGMQVCDALACAHGNRIIHRDLKPQNIFLCEGDGIDAKVLDFGIARLADDRSVTRTGHILGTWSYMSPEQARGDRDIDHRTDLWSVGVVLYQCLSGRLPFDSESGPGTLYQILFESPPDLSDFQPDLPRDLVDIVRRSLSKHRDDRFPTAAAMRSALATIDAAPTRTVRRSSIPVASAATMAQMPALPQATAPTMSSEMLEGADVEVRLSSVVFLHAVTNRALIQGVTHELQGRLITLAGEDLLVVFGTDRWNGDEPQRAVRLATAVAMSAKKIGVATGRAMRGAALVAGGAVNSAVSIARETGVTIDATTAGIVRDAFVLDVQPDGSARVASQVRKPRTVVADSIFPTPFLSRELEMSMLLRAAETAKVELRATGVAVIGAAGMGKSRLRHEAIADLSRNFRDCVLLGATCEGFRRDSPFAALAEALAEHVDPSVLRIFTGRTETVGDPVAALDRARTSLESVLQGLARRGLVVFVIDDAQWLDASSSAAIRWVCENAVDLPLCIWMFGRPESREALSHCVPGVSVTELNALARPAAEQLLTFVAGSAPNIVIERAGGHPLFLEELGRLYATRGAASMTDGGTLPPSIEGAHLAQIDQLGVSDREFMKRAAVFGRVAWVEAVEALGGDAGALTRLRKINLIVPRTRSRFEPQKEFTFRSGVMQEVAYGLWPSGQRAKLHGRAAEWLTEQPAATPDEIAQHWELAGDRARAALGFTEAAEAAARVGDAKTTIAHAERALSLGEGRDIRWRALVTRDDVLAAAGDREVQRLGIVEITELAERLGPEERVEASWRQCYFSRLTGDYPVAVAAGNRAVSLAAELGDPWWSAVAEIDLAKAFADSGEFTAAAQHSQLARQFASLCEDEWVAARATDTHAFVLGMSAGSAATLDLWDIACGAYRRAGDRRREAVALANAAECMLQLGRVSEARERIEAAIEAQRKLGNLYSVAIATQNLGLTQRLEGDFDGARECQTFALLESLRFRHPRLALAAISELIYLGLLGGAVDEAMSGLRQQFLEVAKAWPEGSTRASVDALDARLCVRLGLDSTEQVSRLRAAAREIAANDPVRAEIAYALFEVGGRNESDRAAFLAELPVLTARIEDPADRASCVAAFRKRYICDW